MTDTTALDLPRAKLRPLLQRLWPWWPMGIGFGAMLLLMALIDLTSWGVERAVLLSNPPACASDFRAAAAACTRSCAAGDAQCTRGCTDQAWILMCHAEPESYRWRRIVAD